MFEFQECYYVRAHTHTHTHTHTHPHQLETKCRQLQEELKTEQEAMQRMKEQEAMQQMKEQEAMQQMKEQEAMQQIKFEQSPAPEAVDTDELRKLGDTVMRPIVVSVCASVQNHNRCTTTRVYNLEGEIKGVLC